MNSNDISWLLSNPIAHRGLYDNEKNIPENSEMAFKAAIKQKYMIELDVQVIKDHRVIVFHDDNLKRMCDEKKDVTELGDDYKIYELLGTKQIIPLLDEVLQLVNGTVPLLIDIKSNFAFKKSNMVILNTLLGYTGHVAILSFNPWVLRWFAIHAPTIPRGQLASKFTGVKLNVMLKFLLRNFAFNFLAKPHFIGYDVKDLPARPVERQRKRGKIVLGWGVDSMEAAEKYAAFCDNIIFENFIPSSQSLKGH